jgi:hypothetical protein
MEVKLQVFLTLALMEISDHLQASVALPAGEEFPVPKDGWKERRKILASDGNRIPLF